MAEDFLSSGVHVFVRMQGARFREGLRLLAESERELFLCGDLEEGARRSVACSLGEVV